MYTFHDYPGLVCATCNVAYAVAVNEVYTFQVDRVNTPNGQAGVNLRIVEIWSGPLIICPVCQMQIVVKDKLRADWKNDRRAFDQLRGLVVQGEYLYYYRFNNSLDASIGLARGMLSRDILPPDVFKRFGFAERTKEND